MGCDIHQINILIDAKTKKPYEFSGETTFGEEADYKSEFKPLIEGRCYDWFGILAGVRADAFEIRDNVHKDIPEELPEDIKKTLEDPDYCFHSFTWYYMANLRKELKWTLKKMRMYVRARAVNDPEFISGGDIDEWRWNMEAVKHWIGILDGIQETLSLRGHGEDFVSSKIFFFFDS
jgi:hypothetical protein